MEVMEKNTGEYKIAVLGDRESILGFNALGMDTFMAEDKITGSAYLDKLTLENYAIIYITEPLAELTQDKIDEYKDKTIPAIIPIPSLQGSTGLGMRQLRESVRKAAGLDLLDINN